MDDKDKIQSLKDAYFILDEKGRDALDKTVRKLEEVNDDPERIKDYINVPFSKLG